MQIIRDPSSLIEARHALGDQSLALVPTMGALHAGHMALIEQGLRLADRVAATIFVNPLQFGAGEDLDRYPRQEEADLAMLEAAGCDLVWLPSIADLYPAGFATSIRVARVSERWDGAARPGHFDGVATVVAKLLLAVSPQFTLFGEKDFQQLAVIRRLVTDLGLPTEIVGVPTLRDVDGLALSSRNAYLSPDERMKATTLAAMLVLARQAILKGGSVEEALAAARAGLEAVGFGPIDYVALVDGDTLEPLDAPAPGSRLIAAARLGTTRLIDNLGVR